MKRTNYFKSLLFAVTLLISTNYLLAQTTTIFNDGYITVFKSASISSSTGAAIVLEEYLPSASSASSPNFSVNLPNTASAGSNGIVAGGTTTSNGAISRSENGRYILVPGWSTNSTISTAALGAANTTFSICAVRPVNGSGTVSTGITGTSNWFSSTNDYRGATSDDGTNYWVTGGSKGVLTTTNGTTLTIVTSTSTSTRAINIINGQLFYSTGSSTNGVYQVGIGKPIAASTTSTNLTTSTGAYGFAISPDFLTLYTNSATGVISRWTYSGTYSSGAYSGGSWSTASTGLTLGTATGLIVDWSGYSFSTGANGAIIYASNTPGSGNSTIVRANDNGTAAMTGTTIASVAVTANIFKQIAFSPIKQTVSLGSNTPAIGNIIQGTSNTVLFQFNLSADEGNSTIKKLTIAQTGTAVLGTDITNFKLIYDANGNGIADATEIAASLATGTISGTNLIFSGINQSYINQGSSNNYLVIGNVSASATGTFTPSIVSNKTLNSVNYTTNLVNAGSSYVNIGSNAPTGNTLTIVAPATISVAEGTNFNMAANVGSVATQAITVSGSNLSSSIGLAFTGTDAALFSIDNNSLSQTGGAATIRFTPAAKGSFSASLVLTSGSTTLSIPLSGSSSGYTSLSKTETSLLVSVENNKLIFSAQAGQTIEVFNAVGQKLIHKQAVEGMNSLPVSAKGVVMLKVANRIAKVIL